MWTNSKTPKTNTPNPNPNYKPPIKIYIPEIRIVHNNDGIYDIYIDNMWKISRNHIDNVLQYLSENIETFTLKFEDRWSK